MGQEKLAESYKVLDAVKLKTDETDKLCKSIVLKKGAAEEELTKLGQKCTRLDEQVGKTRKSVAVARAKCDARELTKEMQEKEVDRLDDDSGVKNETASWNTKPSNDDSLRPNSHFPRTVGECSLKVLGHLDKERERTSSRDLWSVMGKWASSTCMQMARTAKSKNGKIACEHAGSIFRAQVLRQMFREQKSTVKQSFSLYSANLRGIVYTSTITSRCPTASAK